MQKHAAIEASGDESGLKRAIASYKTSFVLYQNPLILYRSILPWGYFEKLIDGLLSCDRGASSTPWVQVREKMRHIVQLSMKKVEEEAVCGSAAIAKCSLS